MKPRDWFLHNFNLFNIVFGTNAYPMGTMTYIPSSRFKHPSSLPYTKENAEKCLINGLRNNDVGLVQNAISLGVDLTTKRRSLKGCPLAYACKKELTSIVQAILHAKASPNSERRFTPLHYAIGNHHIVSLLIKANANVERLCEYLGERPLHTAVREGHEETVKLLLSAHADPFALTDKEQNPLTVALKVWNSTDPSDHPALEKTARIIEMLTEASRERNRDRMSKQTTSSSSSSPLLRAKV
jgi:ankyrin repeat protein